MKEWTKALLHPIRVSHDHHLTVAEVGGLEPALKLFRQHSAEVQSGEKLRRYCIGPSERDRIKHHMALKKQRSRRRGRPRR